MPEEQTEQNNVVTASGYESSSPTPATPVDPVAIRNAVEPAIKELHSKIDDYKKELITVLGIFASFITFVSVEFKFLDNVNSTGDFISMTLLLLAGMMFFVITLQSVIKGDENFFKKSIFKLAVGLLVVSIAVYAIPRVFKSINDNQRYYEIQRVFIQ